MRLPNFLVIGAQKAGTTTLFHLLSQHPDLFLPAQKEVQFFSADTLFQRGLDWYADHHFDAAPANAKCGEISPQYMFDPVVAGRIHTALPDVKLIAILREPLDRAYSQFLMSTRRGQETRPATSAFASAVSAEPEAHRYIPFSDYEAALAPYLELFGPKQLLILFQEDLSSDPQKLLDRITTFLGVQPFTPDALRVKANRAGRIRWKWLENLRSQPSYARAAFKNIVPNHWHAGLKFRVEMWNLSAVKPAPLPQELRETYADFCNRQAAFLTKQFGLTPPWPKGEK